jgi:hypothetical protein
LRYLTPIPITHFVLGHLSFAVYRPMHLRHFCCWFFQSVAKYFVSPAARRVTCTHFEIIHGLSAPSWLFLPTKPTPQKAQTNDYWIISLYVWGVYALTYTSRLLSSCHKAAVFIWAGTFWIYHFSFFVCSMSNCKKYICKFANSCAG